MDNCTAHAGDAFLEMCHVANVRLILLPPHSSNQLQMLDLCVFGVTKRLIARLNKLDKRFNVQTSHMVDILTGFHQAASPSTIVASFRNAGISLVMDSERVVRCQISPDTVRCLLDKSALEKLINLPEPSEEDDSSDDIDPDTEAFWEMTADLLYAE
jgi:hypothetical protein